MTSGEQVLLRRLEAAAAFAERRAPRGAGTLYVADVAGGTIGIASPWSRVGAAESDDDLARWRVAWWPREEPDGPSLLNVPAAECAPLALHELIAIGALEPHLDRIRDLADRQIRLLATLSADLDGADRERAVAALAAASDERRRAFPHERPAPLAERDTAVAIGPSVFYGRIVAVARDVEAVVGLLDGEVPPLVRYDRGNPRAAFIADQLLRAMYAPAHEPDWRDVDPSALDADRAGDSDAARALRALAIAEMRRELSGADAYAADAVAAGVALLDALGPSRAECRELALLVDARVAHAVKGLASLAPELFVAGGARMTDDLERLLAPLADQLVAGTRLARLFGVWWEAGPAAARDFARALATIEHRSVGAMSWEDAPLEYAAVALDVVLAGLVAPATDVRLDPHPHDPGRRRARLPLAPEVASELRRLREAWIAGRWAEAERAAIVLEARVRLSAGSRGAPPLLAQLEGLRASAAGAMPPPLGALLPALVARAADEDVTFALEGDELIADVPVGPLVITTRDDLEGLDRELAVLVFGADVAPRASAWHLEHVAVTKPAVHDVALRAANAAAQAALRAGAEGGVPVGLPAGDLPPEAEESAGRQLLRAAASARAAAVTRIARRFEADRFATLDDLDRAAVLAEGAEDVRVIRAMDALLP